MNYSQGLDERIDIIAFFNKMPGTLHLYDAVYQWIRSEFDDVIIRVQKTQISFYNKHLFACVSLPVRRKKSWPELCIILTFGLGHKLEHPRIAVATEPYPGRWTHHVLIQSPDEIDGQIKEWLREAYHFSMNK